MAAHTRAWLLWTEKIVWQNTFRNRKEQTCGFFGTPNFGTAIKMSRVATLNKPSCDGMEMKDEG